VVAGKRQVLSIGGTNDGSWSDPDPAPQGLLLFDMTDLKWKDSYDATAAAYKRANDIDSFYSNGYVPNPPLLPSLLSFVPNKHSSIDAVEWSSDVVRDMFVTTKSITGM
jgi:hypothetical protein